MKNPFKLVVYTLLYLITLTIIFSSIILRSHPLESTLVSVIRLVIIAFATVLLAKYTIYMFLSPWYGLIASREKALITHFTKEYHPLVSVMIPAWNEEIGLISTIKTLLASTYRHIELVVVNDGSTDRSDAMMHTFLAKYEREMAGVEDRIRIIYHYQLNGGKGSALNTAIGLAHGEILLSIDADCRVDRRAVESFVLAFRDPRVMAAVGNVKIGNTRTLVGTIQALEYIFGFYMKKADSLLNTIYIIGGAAGAFRREVFEGIGGYSIKNITEDIHLSMKIQDQGWKIVYVPDALVYTEGASTLSGLKKQRVRWSRGRLECFLEMKHLFFSRRPHHNKLLSWVVLPLAVFSGVQLMVEPLFVSILFLFSFLSGDFSGFFSSIIIVTIMFIIQAYDARGEQSIASLFLAPIGWLLFYVVSYVELHALLTSTWMMIRKKELRWQKWQRQGVYE